MTLTQLDMDECLGFEQAESDWMTALSNAQDNSGQNLFSTVGLGFDQEILDSIMANPTPELCPLARINIAAEDEILAMGGGPVMSPFVMQLFICYYYGVPSTDPAFVSFVKLRRQHIGMVMRALQNNQPGISYGIPNDGRYWKWRVQQNRHVELIAPLVSLGMNYTPHDGFNWIRIDSPVLIKTAQSPKKKTGEVMIFSGQPGTNLVGNGTTFPQFYSPTDSGGTSRQHTWSSGSGLNLVMPVAGTFSNLRFFSQETSSGGGMFSGDKFSISQNGTPGYLSFIVTAGQHGGQSADTLVVAAGDEINFVYESGTSFDIGEWSVIFTPSA